MIIISGSDFFHHGNRNCLTLNKVMTKNLIFKEFWHIWRLNVKLYLQNSAVEEHGWALKAQFRWPCQQTGLGVLQLEVGRTKDWWVLRAVFFQPKIYIFSLKSVSQENELMLQEAYIYIPENSRQLWLLKHTALRKQAEWFFPSFGWPELNWKSLSGLGCDSAVKPVVKPVVSTDQVPVAIARPAGHNLTLLPLPR